MIKLDKKKVIKDFCVAPFVDNNEVTLHGNSDMT